MFRVLNRSKCGWLHRRLSSTKIDDEVLIRTFDIDKFDADQITSSPMDSAVDLFGNVDVNQLTGVQEALFQSYVTVSDLTGLSALYAIPVTVLAGRLLMFPFYVKTRQTMPRYLTSTMKLQIASLELQVDFYGGNTENMERHQQRLKSARNEMLRNLPLIWTLPTGMFLSANLYAMWAVSSQAVSLNIMIPYLNSNLFACDPCVATLATLLQYAAFRTGAELGDVKMDQTPEQIKAKKMTNMLLGFLIGSSLPLQLYVNLPAYISMCWIFNTAVTFSFAQIISRFPALFNLPKMDEIQNEQTFYAEKLSKLSASLDEIKETPNSDIMDKLKTRETLVQRTEMLKKQKENLKRLEEIKKESDEIIKKIKNDEKLEQK